MLFVHFKSLGDVYCNPKMGKRPRLLYYLNFRSVCTNITIPSECDFDFSDNIICSV